MDNYAIALDMAINEFQSGNKSALAKIRRLHTQILDRVNQRLLEGGETSVGGNLLLSASTAARAAAESADVARLANQRSEIANARLKLAEETVR